MIRNPQGDYTSDKIKTMQELSHVVNSIKEEGKKVGLCHGGFDLLHPGHIKHFESAKTLCDVLVVSVTCDAFVSSRKGDGRPIYSDVLRAYSIAHLDMVDYVVISETQRGVEVIQQLRPSLYIKGPDFVHKQTPGILAEKEAIASVGGDIAYTTDDPLSTTSIIDYIKEKVIRKKVLVVLDRDGTLIEDVSFLGRNDSWKDEVRYREEVISLLLRLKTKYLVTFIVVSNQGGVSRGLFDTNRVDEINSFINEELSRRGIEILSWKYSPYADSSFATNNPDISFNTDYVRDPSLRKPDSSLVSEALKDLSVSVDSFDELIVIGDREEDLILASNLNAVYCDVSKEGDYYAQLSHLL